VRELDRQRYEAAEEVAGRKTKSKSWKALHEEWQNNPY
jgi:hypothetical protein